MNKKEKTVLYFLIISLLIGSVISIYKRQRERQNLELALIKSLSGNEKLPSLEETLNTPNYPKEVQISKSKIDINQASAKELEALPGIGPVLARLIIEERNRVGRFSSVEDLLRVKGIGKKKLAKIKDKIKIENSP